MLLASSALASPRPDDGYGGVLRLNQMGKLVVLRYFKTIIISNLQRRSQHMKNQRQDMAHLMMGEWELFLKSNVIL